MSGIFNPDNGFFRLMSKLWDVIVLSVIWCVCCFPLYFAYTFLVSDFVSAVDLLIKCVLDAICMIPVGPAIAALYYAVVKSVRKDRNYVVRSYFHAFKVNFRQGSVISAVIGVAATFISFNLHYAYLSAKTDIKFAQITFVTTGAVTILTVVFASMVFPILSRFSFTMLNLIKMTFYISCRHILWTLLVIAVLAASAIGIYIILPLLFVLPAITALICSFPIEHILKRYMVAIEKKAADTEDENVSGKDNDTNEKNTSDTDMTFNKDKWYLE